MIVLAFILMAGGGLLFAEVFRVSQRGLRGFEIKSPLVYNFRGILQLLSVFMLLGAVVMLFIEKWWLGIVGLVVAPLGTMVHVVVFARMDREVNDKLFGGYGERDESYVRAWAEKHQSELRYSDGLSPESLFAAMMYGLSAFGKKDPKKNASPGLKELGMDASEQFSGDGALFELGCYTYFCLDLWLFKNEPSRREALSTSFGDKFVELFSQALGSNKISRIFGQRISGYAQLVRTGADPKQYHYHLSQLILRTKDNRPPEDYDFDSSPVTIPDIFEDVGLKIELVSWEQGVLRAMIESLRKYCDLTK